MTNLKKLEQAVHDLYDAKDPNREEWADWLNAHHVFVVADFAEQLAQRFAGRIEIARAAALLHDIADVEMSRFDPKHKETSLRIGRELLEKADYTPGDIATIIDDAVRHHSCHDGVTPASLEGKILATADAMAHLKTDFYVYATWAKGKSKTLEEVKAWTLKKLERDYRNKILFPEVQEECARDYQMLKDLFSR
jgi:HD superfamily phosphodiesterase